MQRWHLTAGLAGATALAALVVPSLFAHAPVTQTDPVLAPLPDPTPKVTDRGILSLTAALDQSALLRGSGEDRYLVVEVSAPDLPGDVRRPVDLAVVMDVSGSMAGRGKIDNARMAAAELVEQLGDLDTFALITFDDRARVLLPSTSRSNAGTALSTIRGIRPGGGTNLYDGLSQGLAQLERPDSSGVKRVIILSDGMANIGVTDARSLASLAGSRVESGISVSALGLGLDFNEDLLGAMSDAGGGAYHFVDRPGQLAEMFGDELRQMTRVAGREVALQVDLAEGVELREVYGYQASLDKDGYNIFLGDVHGGETRKIVARVHVPDGALGSLPVADARLRYADAESGTAAEATASVLATVTPDTRVARASVNKGAGVSAARAAAGKLMDESARAWDDGDVATNQAKLAEGRALLDRFNTVYDAPELAAEAEEMEKTAQAFGATSAGSDDALYQVKKAKEKARVYSR